jgi:LmbE family N-acetylglucosaminyl deacetylase
MNEAKFSPLAPKIVLGIAAHPDDLDFGAGGTMAHFAEQGAEVHYLILTDGSSGSDDKTMTPEKLIKIRETEQRAATKAIGGKSVTFLGYPDGQLEITMTLKRDVVKVIRRIRPDVVVTTDPSVLYSADRGMINHPDHRAAGQTALDCVFPLARDHMSFPELYAEGYEPHKTQTILLTNFNTANFYVDTAKTFPKKIAALKAHASQIGDIEQIGERMQQWGRMAGEKAGYDLAEGFVRIDLH